MSLYRKNFTVDWVDTDASGRIHNTAAIRWAEATEHALLGETVGLADVINYPRVRIEVDYRGALGFGDEIAVDLDIERVGRTSFTYGWRIEHGDVIKIVGRTVVVHIDSAGKSSPLPDALRQELTRRQTNEDTTGC